MMFIKLSIAIFLVRLAVQKVYKYILWVSLVVVTIWSIVIFFWNMFQCAPVAAQWDYTIPNGKCVNAEQIVSAAYSISVMTILTDWLFVSALPTMRFLITGGRLTNNTRCPSLHRLYCRFPCSGR